MRGYLALCTEHFAYLLYNFHEATMTIKGSLHARILIHIVMTFLSQNFPSPVKIGRKFILFWKNGIHM